MSDPRALILTGLGLNCERETAWACAQAGLTPRLVHTNDLLVNPQPLDEAQLLVFIGGFSFGDHLGAGRVMAIRLKHRLRDALSRYLDRGGLVLGICNGFQTITKLGLLPGGPGHWFETRVSVIHSDSGVFRDAWVSLRAEPGSPCVFTAGLDRLALPVRHGEGKFMAADEAALAQLESAGQVALRYVDPATGAPTQDFPANPNGSWNAVAGLCDPTGRVFGLMPHPEAFVASWQHPDAAARPRTAAAGDGLALFANAAAYIRANL